LYEDIIPTDFNIKKSLDDYLKDFAGNKGWSIYIDISNNLDPKRMHESFYQLLESNKDKQVIKIR
jgi:hypothetical protein